MLAEIIRRRVERQGPLSIAEYMELALAHPELGYYMGRDPLGRAGDFITAPEISQMFGELIGIWAAIQWKAMGEPERVLLTELGPGRGTLMADMLRAAGIMPPFRRAIEVHLVESSPALRDRQKQTLGEGPVWHDRQEQIPLDAPMIVVANEFFDALPIRQYEKVAQGWRERMVGLDPESGDFRFELSPALRQPAFIPDELLDAPEGGHFEICPAAIAIGQDIGRRLTRQGGVALIVDYGHGRSALGDTLQAVKGHAFADPLSGPGTADLTAHVDFEALGNALLGAGAMVFGPMGQGEFLERLGIGERASMLERNATPEQAEDIEQALLRLTHGEAMGSMFKVMVAAAPGLPPPPPFD